MLLIRKVRRRKGEPLKGWIIRGLKDTDNTMHNTINREENKAIIEFDAIPADLKILDQWVAWKNEDRDGRSTKIPYGPHTLQKAASDDPSTWAPFLKAKACYLEHAEFDGVGVVFTAEDNFTGVDLDDCLDEGNKLADWAQSLLDLFMPTYCEISPSGRGLKLWVRGSKSEKWKRNSGGYFCRKGSVEVYSVGRYFTVTGRLYDAAATEITENQEGLDGLFDLVWGAGEQFKPKVPISKVNESDGEILKRVLESYPKFSQLWGGDFSNYPSQSEADLALCSRIAFWWQQDRVAIDRMFRQSGLYWKKWERSDYRDGTIDKALDGTDARDPLHYFKNEVSCEGSSESYSTAQLPKTDAFYRDTLIGLNGENLLWYDTLGKWLIWGRFRWKFDETRHILKITDGLVNHFLQLASRATDPNDRAEYVELAQRCSSNTRQKSVAEMLKPQLPETVDQLDQHHTLLNVRNGTVDLTTGELIPHSQGDRITKRANASYQPDSDCSRWHTFLNEIMDGNTELIQFLQRAVGYRCSALQQNTTSSCCTVLVGMVNPPSLTC